MTVTHEIKIIDDKIKANQAQYNLSRRAAKISALSSEDLLEKYEYVPGEDLGHKSSVFEYVRLQYFPLGNIFTKELDKDDKKKGFWRD